MTDNNFNFTNGVSYDVWYEQKRLIDQLKEENEELKQEIINTKEIIFNYEYDFIENHRLDYIIDGIMHSRALYKQALDEIESYFIKYDNDKLDSYETLDYIRDIISKAKGEENDR